MTLPAWLPPLIRVIPWTSETYDLLYEVFSKDFIESKPKFCGQKIWFFPETEDGKELIFWHLTSKEEEIGDRKERIPDLRRSERLPWVRPLIEHAEQPIVLWWDFPEDDGTIRTYVWLQDENYVVIMKKYKDGKRRLVTAFYLDYAHTRKKMAKKYEQRI